MKKEIIDKFREDGKDSLLIISDFDETISKGFDYNGERAPTSFSVFRKFGYMGENYVKEANKEFEHYYPIEQDPNIGHDEKFEHMKQWWTNHMGGIFLKHGLNYSMIEEIAKKKLIQLRDDFDIFLSTLQENNIPLIIISSGFGDMIFEFLKESGLHNGNVHIISNFYNFDENGDVISLKRDIIHTMNKDLHEVSKYDFYPKIKDHKNIILLGDKVEDKKMSNGFSYNQIINIGFLNKKKDDPNYEVFEKNLNDSFDLVIDGHEGFEDVNDLLNKILN
jgi:5'-nucleotidase